MVVVEKDEEEEKGEGSNFLLFFFWGCTTCTSDRWEGRWSIYCVHLLISIVSGALSTVNGGDSISEVYAQWAVEIGGIKCVKLYMLMLL